MKARDVRGNTPVQIAVGYNRKGAVRLLLDRGAEVSTIQVAAYLGDLGAVKGFLERGGPVNAQDGDLLSPLDAAARAGQKDVAAFLISQGASVNAEVGQYGTTALHCAASGGSKEVAELLLANGAKVNAKTKNDATPLHVAASWGAKDVVLLLIAHGADVNAEDVQKSRPLDAAVRAGRTDVAKLLIDKGADTVINQDGLLFRACGRIDKDLAELVIRKGPTSTPKPGVMRPRWRPSGVDTQRRRNPRMFPGSWVSLNSFWTMAPIPMRKTAGTGRFCITHVAIWI